MSLTSSAFKGVFGGRRVLLAPMAGVSDPPFRELCIKQGADLTYTEMVSAKGLSYSNEKTQNLIQTSPSETKVAVQIFGHEPIVMAEEAAWIADNLGDKLVCIDINMGCPARKIVKKGDGSSLMKNPCLASDIVRSVKESLSAACVPVTVKFRRGYALGHETAPEFAKAIEAAGADAIAVHGRYAEQMYRGQSDHGCIRRVKEAVEIPVIGNGDVVSAKSAISLIDDTGCDALMIGRASQGNPWIFAELKAALDGKEYKRPNAIERLEMAKKHTQLLFDLDNRSIVKMRKHGAWYVRGIDGASKARALLSTSTTLEDFQDVFDALIERVSQNAT